MPIWVIVLSIMIAAGWMLVVLFIEPRRRALRCQKRNLILEARGRFSTHDIVSQYYSKESIEERIVDIIRCKVAHAANIPDAELILPSDRFLQDLGPFGFDDLETVELVSSLENEFNIKIPNHAVECFRTVDDLIKYISVALTTINSPTSITGQATNKSLKK